MFKLKNRYMHFNRIFAVGVAAVMSIVGVTFFAGDEEIHACTCLNSSPAEALAQADAVFSGTVINIDEQPTDDDDLYYLVFELLVDSVWKGPVKETIFVASGAYRSFVTSCDFRLRKELSYVVYAYGGPNSLEVRSCSRTIEIDYAYEDLEALGEGTVPEPDTVVDPWKPPATPTPNAIALPISTPIPPARPTATLTPAPSLTSTPTATGANCNILASSAHADFVVLPLGLVAGVAWFGFRKRSNRRD